VSLIIRSSKWHRGRKPVVLLLGLTWIKSKGLCLRTELGNRGKLSMFRRANNVCFGESARSISGHNGCPLWAVRNRLDFLLMRNAAERHLIKWAQNGPSLWRTLTPHPHSACGAARLSLEIDYFAHIPSYNALGRHGLFSLYYFSLLLDALMNFFMKAP
jgi:hypothetical protein